MALAETLKHVAGSALKPVRAGEEKLLTRKLGLGGMPRIRVTSADFEADAALPSRATTDGDGTPPTLTWSEPPSGTASYVIICEDPDAPLPEPFVHWIVYGIPATTRSLDANIISFFEGKNTRLEPGFTPAAPPPGHGVHHYHFQVLALDRELDLKAGAGRGELIDAVSGRVVGWGELVGTYEHP